ncbi:MAG: DnaJ domain-containing protein [Candidatus Sericytochromatia bacterium]|nr:DnaJ domain-containing protein [Candidatus Sericytochromatia bacterium]
MGSDKYIDYYELLQVHPKADLESIKKMYYTLMQQHHPDKGGSTEVAIKLTEARDVLMDSKKRREYDQERNLRLLEKMKSLTRENESREKAKEKKVKPNNIVAKNCPVLSSYGVLVPDERGNRILIINQEGEITWEYGKFGSIYSNKLKSPRFANFVNNQNILITDSGNSKVLEVNHKKETIWEFGTGESGHSSQTLDNPSSCTKLNNGNYLICDTNNKRVIEVNNVGEIVWQYGDLKDNKMFGKSLLSLVSKSTYQLFTPTSAQRLDNGNTIISDIGNKKIIEVSTDKKTVWQYPPKKSEKNLIGANFIYRLANNNTIFTFDRVYEINTSGDTVWVYNKNTSDIDINWAYKVDNNQYLINITRIVRRGVNQEIMMVDVNGKTLWRYYYSQYKHV